MAVDSKFYDDATKGFIHISGERFDAEIHYYLRANTVTRLEQFSEKDDGKTIHYLRIYTTGTVGTFLGASAGSNGRGDVGPPMFQLEFTTKEEADKIRNILLELLSAKN